MDNTTACILNGATSAFYRACADSFSQTRQAPWAGWVRAFDGPAGAVMADRREASTLDVACGNLRFARYVQERYPACDLRVYAVDNCAPLVGGTAPVGGEPLGGEQPGAARAAGVVLPGNAAWAGENARVTFQELDIMDALLAGALDDAIAAPACDLVACFGFLHHVPGHENRVRLLRTLATKVAAGGCMIVSFWQFLNSPALAEKAHASHERGLQALAANGLDPAQLEPGDYLLGWQDRQDVFRYCRSFTAEEVAALVHESGLVGRVVDRFEADGRTGNLNAYLVISG